MEKLVPYRFTNRNKILTSILLLGELVGRYHATHALELKNDDKFETNLLGYTMCMDILQFIMFENDVHYVDFASFARVDLHYYCCVGFEGFEQAVEDGNIFVAFEHLALADMVFV